MIRINIILCLLPLILAGWVSQGSFTVQMISVIQNAIEPKMLISTNANNDAYLLSTELNSGYSPNWNVVFIQPFPDTEVKDAVVFGYAYNGRYYWNNPGGLTGRSWIVWKDYNGLERITDIWFPITLGTQKTILAGDMANINQVFDDLTIRAGMLSSDTTTHNWQNAVRIHDQITAMFAGSYTVIVAENGNRASLNVVTTGYEDGLATALRRDFLYGERKLTVLVFGMNKLYGNAVKPTAPFTPDCLTGIRNITIADCG